MLQIQLHGAPCNVRLDNGKVMSGKKQQIIWQNN